MGYQGLQSARAQAQREIIQTFEPFINDGPPEESPEETRDERQLHSC
jgi:hypothetical protein